MQMQMQKKILIRFFFKTEENKNILVRIFNKYTFKIIYYILLLM